jgi:hypothetical protein
LAAYMIVGHPREVFSATGDLERRLMESAQALLDIFERILHSAVPMHMMSPDLTKSLPTALFAYLRDFKAWKVPDEAKLVSRIKHALVSLYQAMTQLPADEPENSQLNIEFRTQIFRLRRKMREIAGQAALTRFDEEYPVGVAASAALENSAYDDSGASASTAVVSVDSAAQRRRTSWESIRAQGAAVVLAEDRMTNEQLAHELLLDITFQLTGVFVFLFLCVCMVSCSGLFIFDEPSA